MSLRIHPRPSPYSFAQLERDFAEQMRSLPRPAAVHVQHWRSEAEKRREATPVPSYPSHDGQEL